MRALRAIAERWTRPQPAPGQPQTFATDWDIQGINYFPVLKALPEGWEVIEQVDVDYRGYEAPAGAISLYSLNVLLHEKFRELGPQLGVATTVDGDIVKQVTFLRRVQ